MTDSAALFRRLARSPRPAGGAAEAEARHVVREALERLGCSVAERPFTYSAWPGVWGVPTVGALLVTAGVVCAVGASVGASVGGRYETAVRGAAAILVVGAVVAGAWLQRVGTRRLPLMRRRGVNLEATRGTSVPRLWLVAHLDSKSQPIPMLLRITAVLTTAASLGAIIVTWLGVVGPTPPAVLIALGTAAAVCALPIALCTTGAASDGALDNASGVATLVATLAMLRRDVPVGVLITSAEELGLAGARAWVEGRESVPVVNFDGIDDGGRTVCMLSHDPGGWLRAAARAAARATGAEVTIRGVVPGVLVDAVAFRDAEWPALTVSRGTWGTFARIHTRRDDLAHMRGVGIVPAARFASVLVGAVVGVGADNSRGDAATGAANGPWNTN